MTIAKLTFLLLLATTTAACSVQATHEGTAPQASTGMFGVKKDDLDIDTPAAFNNVQQVAIGAFNVGFLQYKKASAKAGGGLLGSGMGGKSSAKLTLTGLDDATMQKITDTAYADFVKQLKAKGYSIADRNQLLQSDDFKNVANSPSPVKSEASFFGSASSIFTFAPKALGNIYAFQGEEGVDKGFAFSMPAVAASNFASKTNIPVISVSYVIDFANAEGFGGWYRTSSSVSVGQGVSVAPGRGIQLIGGQGGTFSSAIGSIKLGQPVYSTDTFGEVVDSTSDVGKGVETAVNVATSLLGAGSNISREYEIKATPARYKTVAEKLLGEANGKLVNKMAEMKTGAKME